MKMLHVRWTGLSLLLSGGGAWLIPAEAMDTKASAKCAALGALRLQYRAKAEAILDTSNRAGYVALVNQRMNEEANFLGANKGNKAAMDACVCDALRARKSL